ncbi:MAG: AAA family ATPase, partial [Acidimicrobiales bacterium]
VRDRLLGPFGLTLHHSSFERKDVVCGLAGSFRQGARLALIEELADVTLGRPEVVSLGLAGRAGGELSTTTELLGIETALVAAAELAKGAGCGIVSPGVVEKVCSLGPRLSDEQAEMVRHLLSSGAGVEVVVGKAGSGKTFALEAARAAWEAEGLSVHGTALSARAAAELEGGSGIPSRTLSGLFVALERRELVFGHKDVVVLDEAGMVGTRSLERLTREVTKAGGKIVLVGDPRQLPEIEAGGGLGYLARRLGALQLRENHRQTSVWERRALDELRHGDVVAGLDAYEERGRIHLLESPGAARAAMVRHWAAHLDDAGGARMYALRRSEIAQLNDLARGELARRGLIGADLVKV